MPMTCQHNVAVGAWCRYCGAAVDTDLVRAFALAPTFPAPTRPVRAVPPPRDPDIELYEDAVPAQLARSCGNCDRALLVRTGAWTVCGGCGTETTVMP